MIEFAYDARADAAAAAVLRRLLETIEDNHAGAIDGRDPEALHDFRVAIRRSRAVTRQLKGAFPREQLAQVRAELRWLQRATGDARDLDVYVHGFGALRAAVPLNAWADVQPLLALLVERRRRARMEMERALRSQRARTLLAQWESLLDTLPQLSTHGRPDAQRQIGSLAGVRIRKLYGRIVRMGGAIQPGCPPDDYHELRRQGKELRYMLELFGARLYPDEVVRPMVKALKALQDVLDRRVEVALLRSLEEQFSGDLVTRRAVGLLIGSFAQDEASARAQFAERFDRFASPEQGVLVKRTFA